VDGYSWQTISANRTVALEAGNYQVRLDMLTDGFNLNYLDFVRISDTFLHPVIYPMSFSTWVRQLMRVLETKQFRAMWDPL
jgi:hypothetical protein